MKKGELSQKEGGGIKSNSPIMWQSSPKLCELIEASSQQNVLSTYRIRSEKHGSKLLQIHLKIHTEKFMMKGEFY